MKKGRSRVHRVAPARTKPAQDMPNNPADRLYGPALSPGAVRNMPINPQSLGWKGGDWPLFPVQLQRGRVTDEGESLGAIKTSINGDSIGDAKQPNMTATGDTTADPFPELVQQVMWSEIDV